MRVLYGVVDILSLDSVNINMLVVIFYYGFMRCYLWGNRMKGVQDLFAVLFTT